MLAAAALIGAILLGVPLLLVGKDHDKRQDTAANLPRDTGLTVSGTTGGELGNYVPQPPSTSSDTASQPGGSPESKKHHFKKTASDGKPKTVTASPSSDSGKVRQSAPRPQTSGTAEQKKPSASNAPAAEPVTQGRWATYTFSMTNRLLGKCLVKNSSSRYVAQSSCNNDKWRLNFVGDGTYLIKNVAANQCLDTNGKDMYFSGCATGATGQRWSLYAGEGCSLVIASHRYGDYLTAWYDGTVTLADRSTVDNPSKYMWEAPSLRRC
ncbi:RICIN domain-containing protein [Streptomyces sp. NBC_01320]|uniref:RICIN domain-containing protein n=1 Tax=Streptomyces sp. NBC_01320 TaxID=2903824 RepID=UPI002E0FE7B7|nr:RICIN domain-containing protein [Streptomyces sp. NBC_01320]